MNPRTPPPRLRLPPEDVRVQAAPEAQARESEDDEG